MKKQLLALLLISGLAACAGVVNAPTFTDARLPPGGLGVSLKVSGQAGVFASRLHTRLEALLAEGGFNVVPRDKAEAEIALTLSGTGPAGAPEKIGAVLRAGELTAEAEASPAAYYKDAFFKGDEDSLRDELARAVALEIANKLINAGTTRAMAARAEERRIIARAERHHEAVRSPRPGRRGRPLAVFAFGADEAHAAFAGAMETLLLYDLTSEACAAPWEAELPKKKSAVCDTTECHLLAAKLSPHEAMLRGNYSAEGEERRLSVAVHDATGKVLYEQEVSLPAGEVALRLGGVSKAAGLALGCE